MRIRALLAIRRTPSCVLLRLLSTPIAGIFATCLLPAQTPAPQSYEALHTLEHSSASFEDPDILNRLAVAQGAYPDKAVATYARIAALGPKGSPPRTAALVSGFNLAMRDGQLDQAAAFSAQLEAEGHAEYATLLHPAHAAADLTVLPGGISGLAVMAKIQQPVSPDRILAEFAGKVVQQVCWKCQGEQLTPTIKSYFDNIAVLESAGQRSGSTVTVLLSEQLLSSIGIKVHRDKAGVNLERDNKSEGRPDILAALAIDEAALRRSLQAGKPYSIQIHDESVPIYPGAYLWKASFPKFDQSQFALSLLHDDGMAHLYLGVSTLDPKTLKAVLSTNGLFFFQGQPADMLSLYGSAFALAGTHAWVPGGAAAEPIWSELAGKAPANPALFFQALVMPSKPVLLPFFYAIARLDPGHQAWATANIARTRRLYGFFTSLPESKPYSGEGTPGTSFSAMVNAIPLSEQGSVLFPGALSVWAGANQSATEDDIMLRLFGTRTRQNELDATDFGNFLLVAHIAAHRPAGLDPASAVALARNARAYGAFYPMFTSLTGIDALGFKSFFAMTDSISHLPLLEQELAWGQADSLIEWLVILRRANFLDDQTAARHFRAICDRFAGAPIEAARTVASFELAKAILSPAGAAAPTSWDRALKASLVPNTNRTRSDDFEAVLQEQKAPALDAIFSILDAVSSPATPPKTIPPVQLPFAPIPSGSDASRPQHDAYLAYDPAPLERLTDAWNHNAAHPDPHETLRLAAEILKAAEPQITLALYAPIYATFLRSTDTVVARDPLFLRKHEFVSFSPALASHFRYASNFSFESLGPFGKYLEGNFAEFGSASATAAITDWKLTSGSRPVTAENVAALRADEPGNPSEAGQRLVGLRILAARQWIVAAAGNDAEYNSLSEESLHLLSLYRRAQLLGAIQRHDWTTIAVSATLPDLFRLGGRYLDRHLSESNPSETIVELRSATAAANNQLDFFVATPYKAHGCDQPHLLSAAPYEDDEHQNDPAYLSERAAELKLYLAERADRFGIPPEGEPDDEAVAAKVFEASPLDDYHDWRAMLRAYAAATQPASHP